MAFDITKIPAIQRFHGWNLGADYLDEWFRRSAATAPAYSTPPLTVSIDSVLKFKRAKDIYDAAVSGKVWVNDPAKKRIGELFRKRGFTRPSCAVFGDLSKPTQVVDENYVNWRVCENGMNLDGLTAALANFTFHFAVEGSVDVPATGKIKFTVDKAGIYIIDSFDFNDDEGKDQDLGYWDDSDNSVSWWNSLSGTAVHNSDFRNWRAANKMGGDFRVYSDIKVIKIDPPEVFEV